MLEGLVSDVLMAHLDDIRTASSLSQVNKTAPPIHPPLAKEKRECRLLSELHTLRKKHEVMDFFTDDVDMTSIRKWCHIREKEESELEDYDDWEDLEFWEKVPVLKDIGFWPKTVTERWSIFHLW